MTVQGVEWMVMVAYARAAGAPDAQTAGDWANQALFERQTLTWRSFCEAVDLIVDRVKP